MNKTTVFNEDLGKFLLRLSIGGLMLFYGVAKVIHLNGHDHIKRMLNHIGAPEILWLGVPAGEVIAPILLILGIYTRLSGLLIAFVMLVSVFLARSGEILTLNQYGGLAIDINLLFLLGGLTVFFIGAGKYAIYKPENNWLK